MAVFNCNDIDGFVLSMEEFARLPDSTIKEMLTEGAEVVRKAHVDAIRENFDQKTGKLIGSPKVRLKRGSRGQHALIYPDGAHHTYHAKRNGDGVALNADVGFVHEFGGHGNAATMWMYNSNEKSADATAEAEKQAYDKWLDSINL